MKNVILYLFFLGMPIIMFSQKIKSITEFRVEGDSLIKSKFSNFNTSGNLLSEVTYGNFDERFETFRQTHKNILFEDGLKKEESECEYFVKQDTCVVRTLRKFEYEKATGKVIETLLEDDSSIRFIRHIYDQGRIKVVKTFSWETFPTKKPDFKNASVYIDSIFYDKKIRIAKIS